MSPITKNLQTQLTIDQQTIELIENALKAKKIKCLLQAYFAELDTIRLQKHVSHGEKEAIGRAKKAEIIAQIMDLTSQGNEITKLFGEIADNAHTLIHIPEEASKLLIHGGGIGALVTGILGFTTIPLLCALERRKPKPNEAILMGLSIATIVLGSLAIAAVGGPIGVGVFVLAITAIGLGRTSFNYFQEWRERKALEKEVHQLEQELNDLENALDKEVNNVAKLKKKLMDELNKPPLTIDPKKIESLKATLKQSSTHLESVIKELENKSTVFANKSSKLLELQEKRTSRWELARKGIYVSAGILAVVGAILMLTPAAPIGATLMLAASAITVTTLVSSFVVNRIKNSQAQKSQTKAQDSLHQAQDIETTAGHSSEYIIAQSLTPEGKNVQDTLQKEIENASKIPKDSKEDRDPNPLKLNQEKTSSPSKSPQIKTPENSSLEKTEVTHKEGVHAPKIPEDEDGERSKDGVSPC
ncbi:hypothetical protein [Legionella cincinnatiensis]|uniref:Coiled-coil protein n=1 Tax=Legionella cincinnatiensis TaxID=28085 RepID=A0A378IJ78_9GAMM|nr:hypothetical protein [Legionella cincinnatiensis]KTC91746.1 coiled-coil protein [Legionella cincinnatiensis]STX34551.1 coiled-coil protein [Legionella cincinnatiensis]